MHDPRSGQEGHREPNGVIERRPSNVGRRAIWSGDSCDVVADKQDSIVVPLDQTAFGSEIQYVCGVGALMRGNVWSHSEARECGGKPSWMYRRVASRRGSSRYVSSQSLWL